MSTLTYCLIMIILSIIVFIPVISSIMKSKEELARELRKFGRYKKGD